MNHEESSDLLCLTCRRHGHGTGECTRNRCNTFEETKMLDALRAKSNLFCKRCNEYKILDIFDYEDIVDITDNLARIDSINHTANVMNEWVKEQQKYNLVLGPFRSIRLYGSCSLCRLIFRVFPAGSEDDEETNDTAVYYVRPFPSYDRQSSFLKKTDPELKVQYAIHFSVESKGRALGNVMTYFGDPNSQMIHRVVESFALSSKNPASRRKALGSRWRGDLVDFGLLQHWIKRCATSHGITCQRNWSDELLTIRMIDVQTRQIVPCPPNCDYVALSYVWGQVVPEENALKNRRLPQTIEDTITATQRLGTRYLWVDALCIDQRPSPLKTQQLSIMDVIYQCALVTIIALSGEDSKTGLPGVSLKTLRVPQGVENINGKELLTVFPMLDQVIEYSKYHTRAWTMQEAMLTRCRLVFTNNQVHYWCNSASFAECIDDEFDPANYTESYHLQKQESWFEPSKSSQRYTKQERLIVGEEDYRECVYNYTARQMTSDSDSLNAFLGIVAYLRKSWFPEGLTWGMPMTDFPQALRWYHPRWVKPRRRPAFPSWSWTGWEGQAIHSGSLDQTNTKEQGRLDISTHMTVQFVEVQDQILILDAYIVKLDIRTQPFSDAFVHGTDELLGPVKEGNVLHNNTLPSTTADFLIVERVKYRVARDRPLREDIYMLLLDWENGIAIRRTKVRLFLGSSNADFERAGARIQRVRMK